MDWRCKYITAAIRDAVREKLVPEQNCESKARELYACVIGGLLQAKIENSLGSIRNLKSSIFRLIGASEKLIAGVANLPA
jgi:hypothetical protein